MAHRRAAKAAEISFLGLIFREGKSVQTICLHQNVAHSPQPLFIFQSINEKFWITFFEGMTKNAGRATAPALLLDVSFSGLSGRSRRLVRRSLDEDGSLSEGGSSWSHDVLVRRSFLTSIALATEVSEAGSFSGLTWQDLDPPICQTLKIIEATPTNDGH
jgi:hypothetical protein